MIRATFLAVFSLTVSSALAFPSGAGRCVVGSPSPTGAHGSSDLALSDGDYVLSIEGATLDKELGIITAEAGVEVNITVSGPPYRGVLLMVADQPDTIITERAIRGMYRYYREANIPC